MVLSNVKIFRLKSHRAFRIGPMIKAVAGNLLVKRFYQRKLERIPPELRLPEGLREELRKAGLLGVESIELTPHIISKTDVLYCTRVQEERFNSPEEYARLKDTYIVDNKILAHAKENMAIMHPLPRVNEIKEEVDYDHRAAYFRQMKYGLFVRMALLAMVMGVDM